MLNTKEDILKKVCIQAVLGHQWCPRTVLSPTFFRISSFVFSITKTFIQLWNNLRESKWWFFGSTIPLTDVVHTHILTLMQLFSSYNNYCKQCTMTGVPAGITYVESWTRVSRDPSTWSHCPWTALPQHSSVRPASSAPKHDFVLFTAAFVPEAI